MLSSFAKLEWNFKLYFAWKRSLYHIAAISVCVGGVEIKGWFASINMNLCQILTAKILVINRCHFRLLIHIEHNITIVESELTEIYTRQYEQKLGRKFIKVHTRFFSLCIVLEIQTLEINRFRSRSIMTEVIKAICI